jgi:hypothetical protein
MSNVHQIRLSALFLTLCPLAGTKKCGQSAEVAPAVALPRPIGASIPNSKKASITSQSKISPLRTVRHLASSAELIAVTVSYTGVTPIWSLCDPSCSVRGALLHTYRAQVLAIVYV